MLQEDVRRSFRFSNKESYERELTRLLLTNSIGKTCSEETYESLVEEYLAFCESVDA